MQGHKLAHTAILRYLTVAQLIDRLADGVKCLFFYLITRNQLARFADRATQLYPSCMETQIITASAVMYRGRPLAFCVRPSLASAAP